MEAETEAGAPWPALDALLPALGFVPSRTGSVIATIFGDAVLPRGGSLALADLLALMRRLGASEGVVRTAVSRLSGGGGVLRGRRSGRHSAYALTDDARREFQAAVPAIYGPLGRAWDGSLRLAFPADAGERVMLEAAGFVPLSPATMVGLEPPPAGPAALTATGDAASVRRIAARCWPESEMNVGWHAFVANFAPLRAEVPPSPLDAMAGRTVLIHAYRRLALKAARLPEALRSPGWPGDTARTLCLEAYRNWAPASEAWLDAAGTGSGPLPRGPDPAERFSGGGKPPSGSAW